MQDASRAHVRGGFHCPTQLTTLVLVPQAFLHGGQSLYLKDGCFSDLWALESSPVADTVRWRQLWKGARACAAPPYVISPHLPFLLWLGGGLCARARIPMHTSLAHDPTAGRPQTSTRTSHLYLGALSPRTRGGLAVAGRGLGA